MNAPSPPRIAYLTAGAAGMYCGSCLRDNSLVAALCRQGVDATLIPTYTPIRTDEEDTSVDQVFFGGLNVYLQQRIPLFRSLPAILDRWLDLPWLIRRVAGNGGVPHPKLLGELTLSMLRGSRGNQRKEIVRLVRWLRDSLQPEVVNLTNLLIGGCIPDLKRELGVPIVVTLQGDDLFLDSLEESYRTRAIELMQQLAEQADAFIVFNQFYAEYMQQYLGLPAEKIHRVPLGINLRDFGSFAERPTRDPSTGMTIGYLARLAPEKGLHNLVEAFIHMSRENVTPAPRLLLAGWLGKQDRPYAEAQFRRLDAAGLKHAYEYLGVIDRQQKLDFLRAIDVFTVPTQFQDPKGLYVLEAIAAGVPVVLPAHGAFPELVASTGGGRLCRPHDPIHLAAELLGLLADPTAREQLGRQGQAAVGLGHHADNMARETLAVYRQLLSPGLIRRGG